MNKELEKAIQTLDEAIPEPNNRMVDMAHLRICTAWERIKETLRRQNADQEAGHWIYDDVTNNWRCDKCGETPKTIGYVGTDKFMAEHFKFCNHCGVKMQEMKE